MYTSYALFNGRRKLFKLNDFCFEMKTINTIIDKMKAAVILISITAVFNEL
jgi:hypothetical protein